MSSSSLLSIANLLLPEVLISHFELTEHKIEGVTIEEVYSSAPWCFE